MGSYGRCSRENVGRENLPLPARFQGLGAWKLTDNGQINRRKDRFIYTCMRDLPVNWRKGVKKSLYVST